MQTTVEDHGHRLARGTVVSAQELPAFAIHDCHCVAAGKCEKRPQRAHGVRTLEGESAIANIGPVRFRDIVESSDEWANVSRTECGLVFHDPLLQSLSFTY